MTRFTRQPNGLTESPDTVTWVARHRPSPDPNGRDNCVVCGRAIRFDDRAPHRTPVYVHADDL